MLSSHVWQAPARRRYVITIMTRRALLIEGTGAPFYPQGEQPRTACPMCVRDKGDSTPKALFGIRGTAAGQHDPAIPDDWFQCPPIRIDGTAPGMDAVRVSSLRHKPKT